MVMYQVPEADLTEDQRKSLKRAVGLRAENARMADEMEKMGAGFETLGARMDFTLNKMLEWDILTVDQHIDLTLSWEEHLREQFQAALPQVRQQFARMQVQARENQRRQQLTKYGVATPKPDRLIVPGR